MRITSVNLKNIGVFDNETITFQSVKKKEKTSEVHILTGPNGSGKTTLLYALASTFDYFMKGHKEHTSNFFYKRFRYFEEEKEGIYKSEVNVFLNENDSVKIYGCPNPECHSSIHSITEVKEITKYRELIGRNYNLRTPLSFAAFSYSGYRFAKSEKIHPIDNSDFNPLFHSLEFIKSNNYFDSVSINQWIANNISIYALEKMKGVKTRNNPVTHLSKVLEELIGEKIEFEIETKPTVNLYLKMKDTLLDFDVLPDGLRSLISWIGDLLMRLDLIPWEKDIDIFERRIILFLDEIEVHLHPEWQRKILPIITKLFKNAQIFLTTHSPFILNSITDAIIYEFKIKGNKSNLIETNVSNTGYSFNHVNREIFDLTSPFGYSTQENLLEFYKIKESILSSQTITKSQITSIKKIGKKLALKSEELKRIVLNELKVLSNLKNTKIEI